MDTGVMTIATGCANGISCIANFSDGLTTNNRSAWLNGGIHRVQVGIAGEVPVAVIKLDVIAVTSIFPIFFADWQRGFVPHNF